MDISPQAFFDLRHWSHRALFAGLEMVWEVFPDRLKAYLDEHAVAEINGEVSKDAYLEGGPIVIGEGSVVEAGAFLRGPLIIGKRTQIRHGAYIRGNCLIGDDCVIGHSTELKSAIFLDGAKAGHFAYVGDSILGNEVNLGAGTKLANFKLNQSLIKIRTADKSTYQTGLRKLGAILGDNVQTGCNSVCSPGVLMGKGSLIHPCLHVAAGVYSDKSVLR